MSHKNKVSLYLQMCHTLESKLTIGRSKHQDKLNHDTADHIYSYDTLTAYKKHCGYFVDYCKKNRGSRTLDQCKPYIAEWLNTRSDLSAYTIKLEAAAIAKLYGISTTDRSIFPETKSRTRSAITRSRSEAVRDKHFSKKNNANLIEFCRSTGLRRHELVKLTGECLVNKDGRYYIYVKQGKGGKSRFVPVIGNIQNVVDHFSGKTADDHVFDSVSGNADIHGYRSEYATALYKLCARPFDECIHDPFYNPERKKYDANSVYRFRKDRSGQWLDKKAMLVVSKALGHNRISVVGEHYIRL